MKQSESINELATALAKAQGEFSPAEKDSKNPFFKSSYATLASVIAVLNPVLPKHGLSFAQMTDVDEDGKTFVETQIMHSSGQWIRGKYPVKNKDPQNPQSEGSGTTYAKRYALMAAFGIPSEDDDGQGASGKPKNTNDAPEKPSSRAISDSGEALITEPQRKRLFAIAKKNGVSDDEIKSLINSMGFETSKDITWMKYDQIIKAVGGSK